MLIIVYYLDFTTAVSFINRIRESIGHLISIEDDASFYITSGTTNRLD